MANKTVGGFLHLAGKEVRVYANGALYKGGDIADDETHRIYSIQTVSSSGTVEVDSLFYGSVTAGIAYTARIKTLPISYEAAAASRGTVKNISKVFMRTNGQGTVMVGPNEDKLVAMMVQQSAVGDTPELVEVPVIGDWNGDACLVIEHSDPLPFMLQALVLEIATGG